MGVYSVLGQLSESDVAVSNCDEGQDTVRSGHKTPLSLEQEPEVRPIM
jgi:hypothetical protein